MRHLLNSLFITTQGSYVAREGETLLIRVEHETRNRFPVVQLQSIVCFGQVSMSPPAMELCAEHGVTVSFLSEQGKFIARVVGPVSGNVLLRREQYRYADVPEMATIIARNMLTGKLVNCRNMLMRAAREREDVESRAILASAAKAFTRHVHGLADVNDLDTLRGKEGSASADYFAVFDHFIAINKDDFLFRVRSRRPPLDNINALLSFIYTLLVHDTVSALECVGLDPAVGFLHRDRPGRPGLALDMMEELRPALADRLVVALVNRQQVQGKGFTKTESGGVLMDNDTRKTVLVAWQERKQEEIMHPFIGEKIKIGLIPHVQAQLFARFLRDDLEAYPPFFWK
jgi:CRISPR-associated protein Cas1